MARKFAPGRPDNAFADESEHPRREPVIDKASAKKTSHMRADGRAAENRRQQAPAVVEHHGRHETPGPETYGPHDAAQSRAPYAGHIDADAQQVADLHYGEDYDDARLSDAETVERNEPDFAPPEPPDLAGRPDPREQYAPVRLREAAFAEDETGGDAGGKISDPRRVERAQFDERRHRDIEAGLVRNISTGGANIPYHVIDVVFAVAETATDDNDLAGCPDEAFADCKEALWRQCRYLDGDAVLFCRFGWDRDRAMFTDGKAVAFNAAMRPDEGGLRARPMQDKSVIRVWGQGTVVAFHQQAGMDGADEHDDFRNGDPHAPAIAGRQAAE